MPAPPAAPLEPEVHIAGVMVQARPGCEPAVAAALSALPHTEAHVAAGAAGKLVAVCEGSSGAEIMDLIARMGEVPGVVNVALVYQHAESAGAMEEEIGNETDPPRFH